MTVTVYGVVSDWSCSNFVVPVINQLVRSALDIVGVILFGDLVTVSSEYHC